MVPHLQAPLRAQFFWSALIPKTVKTGLQNLALTQELHSPFPCNSMMQAMRFTSDVDVAQRTLSQTLSQPLPLTGT